MTAAETKRLIARLAKLTRKATGAGMTAKDVAQAKGVIAKLKAAGHSPFVSNPAGKSMFDRCVAAVEAKGKARSPRGVCAAAGRKKYGAKKFAAKAAAGRKRRKSNAPKWHQVARGLTKVQARVSAKQHAQWFQKTKLRDDGARGWSVLAYGRRERVNPSNAEERAAERYEEFHGQPPSKVTEFETVIHEPAVTSGIGKLVRLVILAVDGKTEVTLENFRGAILSQNIEGTQLYIDGGDQRVNLADFGINAKLARVHEVLGACREVWYDTNKVHLGEDGGDAIYHHKFGGRVNRANPARNAWGASSARMPMVVYSVRNKLLMFAGGGYTLPKEGISG